MGKVELFELNSMMPTESGLMKRIQKSIVFIGQSKQDITQEIQKHYHPKLDYPLGNDDLSKHWTWGYFRMTKGIRTYSKAFSNQEQTCMFNAAQMGIMPNTSYDGAFVTGKNVFILHENNPDIFLFVMFNEFEVRPM